MQKGVPVESAEDFMQRMHLLGQLVDSIAVRVTARCLSRAARVQEGVPVESAEDFMQRMHLLKANWECQLLIWSDYVLDSAHAPAGTAIRLMAMLITVHVMARCLSRAAQEGVPVESAEDFMQRMLGQPFNLITVLVMACCLSRAAHVQDGVPVESAEDFMHAGTAIQPDHCPCDGLLPEPRLLPLQEGVPVESAEDFMQRMHLLKANWEAQFLKQSEWQASCLLSCAAERALKFVHCCCSTSLGACSLCSLQSMEQETTLPFLLRAA